MSHADQVRRTLDSPTTIKAGQMDNRKRTERRQQPESWMEARRTYKPTSQQTTATEAKPPASETTDVEVVDDECGRKVLSLPPELVMVILEYLPLEDLLLHVRLVNRMCNTFALNRTGLLVADWISMATWGITARLQFLYRGHTSGESFMFKRNLSTRNDQWPISMDFESMDRSRWDEYYYRHRFPVVKGIEHPVVKRVELNLTESDSRESIWNSERTELKPRVFLRFEPGVDRQNHLAGNKRGSIWMEFSWSKTVREILNLKPIMSKDFGFKFDFVWKTRRGLYDDQLYYYTDHGSMSRIAREEDIGAGSLYIY
jgi:hypothetical protein